MAKKRKVKKSVIIISAIAIFFAFYMLSFKLTLFLESKGKDEEVVVENKEEQEDTRSLRTQLNTKEKIYVSDSNIENIRIEEKYWDEIKFYINNFAKVRESEKIDPIYTGYTDDGLRFSTDLNIFRIYTVNKQEYYKIPVSDKEKFSTIIKGSMYTSFDFVKKYKTWDKVTLTYGDETKKLNKWKFDDLSYKMVAKRMVGKVQPEKSKERSEYNFTIDIEGENYSVKLETMGKDYVKITSDKGYAYYEVPTLLFEYIKDEVFKIEAE